MERRGRERYFTRPYELTNPIYNVYPYSILNISRSGCALVSGAPFRIETGPAGFEIPLHHRTTILKARVETVWKNVRMEDEGVRQHVYGLRFLEMDPENHMALNRYVDFARCEMALSRLETAWDRVKEVQNQIGSILRNEEMDTINRGELDRCVDLLRQDMASAGVDPSWETVRDIQEKIRVLFAYDERKKTVYLN